jgi:hypothetical protein
MGRPKAGEAGGEGRMTDTVREVSELIGKVEELKRLVGELGLAFQELAAGVSGLIAPLLADLDALSARVEQLAQVGDQARTAKADLDAAHGSAEAFHGRMLTVAAAQEGVRGALASTVSSMSTAAAAVDETAAAVSASAGRAVEAGQRAAEGVRTAAQQIEDGTANTHQVAATRLDDLAQVLANAGNRWDKALGELIDSVKLGATDVQDLLTLWGDAVVQGQRVREFLKGLDLTVYRDNVQELVRELHDGRATIDDTLQFLGQSQLAFAKQFKEVIELFQSGKVTLQRVREVVAQIEKLFPDTDFADLAEAIEDALRKGQL